MRRSVLSAGLLVGMMAVVSPTAGQVELTAPQPAGRGEDLTIYLMTMGAGSAVWERFGHNAIWVHDATAGTDIAYNYGVFSFEQENFLLRFIRGEMNYWVQREFAVPWAEAYAQVDRSVWLQELNLTPTQRADLRDFLEWNVQPENRFYRYDYYRDNCSTRVRDAIDLVLGGQLKAQTEGTSTGTTYRDHTRALTIGDPLLYAGLMAGLGQPVDRTISIWEEMFLPMRLRELVRNVTVRDAAGRSVPLVLGEQELYRSSQESVQEIPSGRPLAFFGVGLVLAGLIALSGRRVAEGRRAGGLYTTLVAAWCFVAGFVGFILLGLWAFTDHTVAYRNENVFFLRPLLLMMAFIVPLALRRGGGRAARMVGLLLGVAIGVLSIAGLVLQVLPALFQENGEIIALALPVNLAVAISLVWIWRSWREGDPALQARRGGGGRAAAFTR